MSETDVTDSEFHSLPHLGEAEEAARLFAKAYVRMHLAVRVLRLAGTGSGGQWMTRAEALYKQATKARRDVADIAHDAACLSSDAWAEADRLMSVDQVKEEARRLAREVEQIDARDAELLRHRHPKTEAQGTDHAD